MQRVLTVGAAGALVLLVAVVGIPVSAGGPVSGQTLLTADLAAANQVPPLGGGETGSAAVVLDHDLGRVCFAIELVGADPGDIVAAHIHTGGATDNGSVLIDLDHGANGLVGCADAADADLAAVAGDPGGHYVNVHSVAEPAGLIRGQLEVDASPTTDFPVVATPDAEVPPVASDAQGVANFTISTGGIICKELELTGLASDVIGTHIHQGPADDNGPILVDLAFDTLGLGGCVPAVPAVAAAILDDPGGFYLNVHTDDFATGEVRAQLDQGGVAPGNPDAPPAEPEPAESDLAG